MSQGPIRPEPDARLRPARLAAYYGLLLFFILLVRALLGELASRYNLAQFRQINDTVRLILNQAAAFDEVVHTVFSLFLALMFTLPLAWVYTLTKEEEDFDPSLVQTLVVLAMAVTGVMIVIGTELARAFSLAGVVAAVRFRTTLDDTKDTVYIFIAVGIGMACGARAYPVAVWFSIVMTATMYLLWKYRFGRLLRRSSGLRGEGRGKKAESLQWVSDEASQEATRHSLEQQARLLQWASAPSKEKKKLTAAVVVDASDLDAAQRHVDAVLAAFGGKWKLAGVTSNGDGGVLEYLGRPPKESTPGALVAALREGSPPAIAAIEFRSLKGLRLLPAPPAGADAD